jgi:hypothetical protein
MRILICIFMFSIGLFGNSLTVDVTFDSSYTVDEAKIVYAYDQLALDGETTLTLNNGRWQGQVEMGEASHLFFSVIISSDDAELAEYAFAQFPHLLVADATTDALTLTNGANTWQVSGAHLDAWALWTDHHHDLVRDFAALGLAYQQLAVPDLAQADYYFGTIVRQSEMEAYWVSRNSLLYDIGEYSAVPQKHAEIRFLVAEETNRQLTLLDIQSYFALESDSMVLQLTDNIENPDYTEAWYRARSLFRSASADAAMQWFAAAQDLLAPEETIRLGNYYKSVLSYTNDWAYFNQVLDSQIPLESADEAKQQLVHDKAMNMIQNMADYHNGLSYINGLLAEPEWQGDFALNYYKGKGFVGLGLLSEARSHFEEMALQTSDEGQSEMLQLELAAISELENGGAQ